MIKGQNGFRKVGMGYGVCVCVVFFLGFLVFFGGGRPSNLAGTYLADNRKQKQSEWISVDQVKKTKVLQDDINKDKYQLTWHGKWKDTSMS